MKRYIRLKDDKIIDAEKYPVRKRDDFKKGYYSYLKNRINYLFNKKEHIVAESDDIADLIKVGDLVRTYLDYPSLECITEIEDKDDLRNVKLLQHISKLYTKQGDNYILVWDKERGVI